MKLNNKLLEQLEDLKSQLTPKEPYIKLLTKKQYEELIKKHPEFIIDNNYAKIYGIKIDGKGENDGKN